MTTIADLKENFELFDDWESRYVYVLDIAKKLPPFPEDQKTDVNKVEGCVSQVWMLSEMKDGKFTFIGDSDAIIVRGLIGILRIAYDDKTPEEIAAVDIEQDFADLGLNSHLSPNRRNGFFAMVERIKQEANLEQA